LIGDIMVHDTYSSLIKDINNTLKNVAQTDVSKEMESSLRRATNEFFYMRTHVHHPNRYLVQAVDSQVKESDGGLELSVFHNPSKMSQYYPSWVQGYSDDNRNNIILWLNEGTSGSPIYNHEAYRFIDKGKEDIDNKIINWYKMALKKRGIEVL